MCDARIKAILFDVGGVLSRDMIDTKLRDLARKYRVEEERLLGPGLQLRVKADLGQMSDGDYWRQVLDQVGVSATVGDLEIGTYLTLVPGTLELARRLKNRGHRVGILSNDSREMAAARREKLGFDALFEPVFISGELGMAKPKPGIYNYAVEWLQVRPGEVLFIDNRQVNVDGARALGLQAVHFENAAQLEGELRRRGLL
jgi:putative hydrolase of the HAD superfamily